MDIEQYQATIRQIEVNFSQALAQIQTLEALTEIKTAYLGKKGEVTAILKNLGEVPKESRSEVGKSINQLKAYIETACNEMTQRIITAKEHEKAKKEWLDYSINKNVRPLGHFHPISRIQFEIEQIFASMGFIILDGPEVETEYYNFEALNIPKNHPARDMQDTFWTIDNNLLRTHTSAIQIRGMENLKPPFRAIAPGRVFRYEALDASHENTFYQVEGLMVGRNITVANLIFIMKVLLREIFKREVTIRLRPGYFPFVEPGFELDIRCHICGGGGCSVCKQSGWVELLPCGLVHPNVLRHGNIDPTQWSGFAFGLGLNRLVMMRYQIDDIRYFQSGDLRFLYQF